MESSGSWGAFHHPCTHTFCLWFPGAPSLGEPGSPGSGGLNGRCGPGQRSASALAPQLHFPYCPNLPPRSAFWAPYAPAPHLWCRPAILALAPFSSASHPWLGPPSPTRPALRPSRWGKVPGKLPHARAEPGLPRGEGQKGFSLTDGEECRVLRGQGLRKCAECTLSGRVSPAPLQGNACQVAGPSGGHGPAGFRRC